MWKILWSLRNLVHELLWNIWSSDLYEIWELWLRKPKIFPFVSILCFSLIRNEICYDQKYFCLSLHGNSSEYDWLHSTNRRDLSSPMRKRLPYLFTGWTNYYENLENIPFQFSSCTRIGRKLVMNFPKSQSGGWSMWRT